MLNNTISILYRLKKYYSLTMSLCEHVHIKIELKVKWITHFIFCFIYLFKLNYCNNNFNKTENYIDQPQATSISGPVQDHLLHLALRYNKHLPQQLMLLMVISDDDEVTEICEILQEKMRKRFPQCGSEKYFWGLSWFNLLKNGKFIPKCWYCFSIDNRV